MLCVFNCAPFPLYPLFSCPPPFSPSRNASIIYESVMHCLIRTKDSQGCQTETNLFRTQAETVCQMCIVLTCIYVDLSVAEAPN